MDVGDWLRNLGLECYEAAFRENGVSGEVLRQLTAEDLKELGIVAVGHRRQLLVAIASLDADASSTRAVVPGHHHRLPSAAAERRHITVLFSDIVGSVTLSARLDPEELGELLSAYQVNVANAVTAEHGYIARFVGDGVLAYFGWPNADEAHADSAVRAALEIVEAVGRQQLAVRIGIATGLVVTGDLVGVGAAQTMTAVGDTPNLAARLQTLARPDTIVISEATRSQLGGMFELEDLGHQALKGFDKPAKAWRVIGKAEAESRSEVVYGNAPAPLVGRREELDLLLRRWHEAKAGQGRLVLLSGEPGIGKSRLLAALEERLQAEPHVSLRYFCSSHHQDTPLYPLIARLEREAGFVRGDTASDRLAKLETVLAPAAPPPEDIALMAAVLSIPPESRHPLPELSPQQRKMRTVAAVLRRLSALTRRGPVLILFEDAHWSDPSSIELLDAAIGQLPDLPVLLVVSSRPDFVPPWIGRPGVDLIGLSRLDRAESATLAARVATRDVISQMLLDRIVDQADGVPLFVEELTKAVEEARTTASTGTLLDAARQPLMAVPGTLHASLMARLDRLGSTKEVAQVGAVIGRTFDFELLAAVSGWADTELESALQRLDDSGLVFALGALPRSTYMFKHALVQDTAYDSLLRGPRKALHRKVAEALELRTGVDEIRPELLAHHWSGAGETRRAVQCWLNGARHTLGRLAPAEALLQTGHGLAELATLPEDDWRRQTEIELQLVAANALMVTDGHAAPRTGAALMRAADLCEQLPSAKQRPDAQLGLWSHLMLGGKLQRAVGMAEAMLSADNQSGDVRWRLAGLRTRGIVRFLIGHFDESIDDLQQFVALWDSGQPSEGLGLVHDPGSISVHCYKSYSLTFAGRIAEARHHAAAAMEGARASGHHLIVAQAMFTEAVLEYGIGAYGMARPLFEQTLDYAVEHGVVYFKMFAATHLSTIEGLEGDVERALHRIADEIEFVRSSGTYSYMPGFLAREGELLALAGRTPEALTRFAESFALMEQTGAGWDEPINRRRFARALVIAGRPQEAEAELRRAMSVARKQRARLYELEVVCDLAPMLARNSRTAEACEMLKRSLDYFAQENMIPTMARARDILMQLYQRA